MTGAFPVSALVALATVLIAVAVFADTAPAVFVLDVGALEDDAFAVVRFTAAPVFGCVA